MRKALLIIGIILIIACVLSLIYAALNLHGYHNIYDGSPELYDKLHRRVIIFSITGAALALTGAACIVFR